MDESDCVDILACQERWNDVKLDKGVYRNQLHNTMLWGTLVSICSVCLLNVDRSDCKIQMIVWWYDEYWI